MCNGPDVELLVTELGDALAVVVAAVVTAVGLVIPLLGVVLCGCWVTGGGGGGGGLSS